MRVDHDDTTKLTATQVRELLVAKTDKGGGHLMLTFVKKKIKLGPGTCAPSILCGCTCTRCPAKCDFRDSLTYNIKMHENAKHVIQEKDNQSKTKRKGIAEGVILSLKLVAKVHHKMKNDLASLDPKEANSTMMDCFSPFFKEDKEHFEECWVCDKAT